MGQVGNLRRIGNPPGRKSETAEADFQSAADCQSAPLLNRAVTDLVPLRQRTLNFIGISGQCAAQDFRAGLRHENDVFDANPDILLGDINPWLDRDDHARFQGLGRIESVMHVETDVMREAVREVLAQRLSVKVFAVRVDVVECDLV